VLALALDMLGAVRKMLFPNNPSKHLLVRIGLHSGASIAGVVGTKLPRYSFYGETAAAAQHLGRTAPPMNVVVSGKMAGLLGDACKLEPMFRSSSDRSGSGMVECCLVCHEVCEWQSVLEKIQAGDCEAGLGSTDGGDHRQLLRPAPAMRTMSRSSSFGSLASETQPEAKEGLSMPVRARALQRGC
jgi:hypothetical protein